MRWAMRRWTMATLAGLFCAVVGFSVQGQENKQKEPPKPDTRSQLDADKLTSRAAQASATAPLRPAAR